jgi:hypothetical protein
MKISFEVGTREKHRIDFSWNQLIGTLRIKVDGELIKEDITSMSPISWSGSPVAASDEKWNVLDSGFEVALVDKWAFEIGEAEKHEVRIEKERAKLLAGFRRQRYRVFVDGQLITEYEGY